MSLGVSRFSLSTEQFEKEYASEIEPLSKANPVVRLMTPILPRFRWREAYMQTRRALLRAAIAVQLDGPAALSQQPDPHDGKSFSYSALEGGFRLESDLKDGQQRLSTSTVPTAIRKSKRPPENSGGLGIRPTNKRLG